MDKKISLTVEQWVALYESSPDGAGQIPVWFQVTGGGMIPFRMMNKYHFANYRLLVDDAISNSDHMDYLAGFSQAMPATHTFTLHLGDEARLDSLFAEASRHPMVCTTELFNIHDMRAFYHLKYLPNKDATELTRKTICKTYSCRRAII